MLNMTADNIMILAAYIISCIALAISLYVLYTLDEKETENKKPNNAWDYYHKKSTEKVRPKGYWD